MSIQFMPPHLQTELRVDTPTVLNTHGFIIPYKYLFTVWVGADVRDKTEATNITRDTSNVSASTISSISDAFLDWRCWDMEAVPTYYWVERRAFVDKVIVRGKGVAITRGGRYVGSPNDNDIICDSHHKFYRYRLGKANFKYPEQYRLVCLEGNEFDKYQMWDKIISGERAGEVEGGMNEYGVNKGTNSLSPAAQMLSYYYNINYTPYYDKAFWYFVPAERLYTSRGSSFHNSKGKYMGKWVKVNKSRVIFAVTSSAVDDATEAKKWEREFVR